MSVIDGLNDELLDEQRLAVPRDKAITISGLSPRQVDYWARSGLVEPAVDTRVSPGRRIRGQVYFQHPDGQWEGDLRPDQLVLQQVLDLQPLRQRIAEGTRRADDLSGKVEQRRGALGNPPCLCRHPHPGRYGPALPRRRALHNVCDHDLDAAVPSMLRKLGHEAWTVANAGLSDAADDDLTIYAQEHQAALITHDSEFSERRRRNVVGQHIYLKCTPKIHAVRWIRDISAAGFYRPDGSGGGGASFVPTVGDVGTTVGLAKLYNQLHAPAVTDEEIRRLREIHTEIDYATAEAYGWDDFDLAHGFYDTRQGCRFTIAPDIQVEVLNRLLELNHERYAEEVQPEESLF